MTTTVEPIHYYNENDPKAAAWLRELIEAGLIPAGEVDERDIQEIRPVDLMGFTQCHFFAGIAGWSYALQLAGWPASRSVWTASCPCQPFSQAGHGLGEEDPRHLWPFFRALVRECAPSICFGEQVSSPLGRGWLARVRADLEALGYAVGAADLCAASVGAPHIRQRLYWVANAVRSGRAKGRAGSGRRPVARRSGISGMANTSERRRRTRIGNDEARQPDIVGSGEVVGLGVANGTRSQPRRQACATSRYGRAAEPTSDAGRLADPTGSERRSPTKGRGDDGDRANAGREEANSGRGIHSATGGLAITEHDRRQGRDAERGWPGATLPPSAWSNYELIPCGDGKARRIERGTFPLVAGLPKGVVPSGDPSLSEVQATAEARVMRLKGYGNAIVPQVAAVFIQSVMDLEAAR